MGLGEREKKDPAAWRASFFADNSELLTFRECEKSMRKVEPDESISTRRVGFAAVKNCRQPAVLVDIITKYDKLELVFSMYVQYGQLLSS